MKKEEETLENLSPKKLSALKISIKEGSFASMHKTITETYIPQLALALKASSFQIGILSALSGLVSPFAQFFGTKLMEKHPRKKIVLFFAFLQTLLFIPFALLGYLIWKGLWQSYSIPSLIVAYVLLSIFSGMIYPVWFSWMGDLVPERQRGIYFSKRHRIAAIATLITLILGLGLDIFESKGLLLLGFSILFIIAGIFSAISLILLRKQYAPAFKTKKDYYFSIFAFLKRFDSVGKFAVYYALLNAVLYIASPFFAVYMRENLQFNYLTITLISLSSTVFYILFAPSAGRFSDKYGNVRLFYLGATLISLNPLLWMFIKNPLVLIIIPQLITGLANAAIVISVTNFIYSMVSPAKRALCMSYTNILNGIGIFIGSIVGGLIIMFAPISALGPMLTVFLISGVLRLLVSFAFIGHLKEEEKNIKRLPDASIHLKHPLKGLIAEVEWLKRLHK